MLLGTQRINQAGHLEIGGCDTVELAHEFGTPLYVMDEDNIRENCRRYKQAFAERYPDSSITFAGKAFLNLAMCRIADEEGVGLDVASDGELYTAIQAGFPMERILFHGNNKSVREIEMALTYDVGRVVVDNFQELETLASLAAEMGKEPKVLLRCTPGIHPHTHRLISTGQADTKFGFNIADGSAMKAIVRALELPRIALKGIHCHIGSQLLDTMDHEHASRLMAKFAREILDKTGLVLEEIDLGGGLGIRYIEKHDPPSIEEFAERTCTAFLKALAKQKLVTPKLLLEPGRSIVGEAGTTLYTVGAIKEVHTKEGPKTYAAVDGGLSDNPRPALYNAVYEAIVANKASAEPTATVAIAGKHCETDVLIKAACIAPPETGDILAVQSTGAYNYAMASNYNRLTRPACVLVSNGHADLIARRESLDDLISHDMVPERLRSEIEIKN